MSYSCQAPYIAAKVVTVVLKKTMLFVPFVDKSGLPPITLHELIGDIFFQHLCTRLQTPTHLIPTHFHPRSIDCSLLAGGSPTVLYL